MHPRYQNIPMFIITTQQTMFLKILSNHILYKQCQVVWKLTQLYPNLLEAFSRFVNKTKVHAYINCLIKTNALKIKQNIIIKRYNKQMQNAV